MAEIRAPHPPCSLGRMDHSVFHVVVRCCSHTTSHDQDRGHKTGSNHSGAEVYPREKAQTNQSHSGAEEYPREKTQTNQRWHTHISQLTQFMPPPETCKSEIGSSIPDPNADIVKGGEPTGLTYHLSFSIVCTLPQHAQYNTRACRYEFGRVPSSLNQIVTFFSFLFIKNECRQ